MTPLTEEQLKVMQAQYAYWNKFMQSQGEDPEFWYAKHIEKDHPMTLTDHFVWLRKAGFSEVACQWRLFYLAITPAKK